VKIKHFVPQAIILLVACQALAATPEIEPIAGLRAFLNDPRSGSSNEGLVVIRNFTSGFGARGKDIRHEYPRNQVPLDGVVPVQEEVPISAKEMFASLPQETTRFSAYRLTAPKIILNENSNATVPSTRELLDRLHVLLKDAGPCSPCIISSNDTAVVGDAQIVTGLLVGNLAILRRENNGWKVRAIIDRR